MGADTDGHAERPVVKKLAARPGARPWRCTSQNATPGAKHRTEVPFLRIFLANEYPPPAEVCPGVDRHRWVTCTECPVRHPPYIWRVAHERCPCRVLQTHKGGPPELGGSAHVAVAPGLDLTDLLSLP